MVAVSANGPAAGPVQVVWFKRDLRIHDHVPLATAARHGPVLPLHVAEPELWLQPDMAARQWEFAAEALHELRAALATLGQPLIIRTGEVIQVLASIHDRFGIAALWSHQETGNGWTYARDRCVRAWCDAHGIPWHEPRQHGVIRRLGERTGWAGRWNRFMARRIEPPPDALTPLADIDAGGVPDTSALGLSPDPCPKRLPGGRSHGLALLDSFLEERGEAYQRAMSSPLSAFDSCSRLSVHLAFGTVSMREVYQAARRRQELLEALPPAARGLWPGAMRSFVARLHWHCHFMQKLEDEPAIECRNFHPAFDGLRDEDGGCERLEAWMAGRTGFPFVDACMRALDATGYLHFRGRAMLTSFAAYQLWLHWRRPGLHLARLFTDYEPGIHWSQCQMQSATTGINLPRIYNPIKQGLEHDPDGAFVRRWVPELADVPPPFLHQPWTWDGFDRAVGRRYPRPIVDERAARKAAQERIWALRRDPGYGAIADAIQARHGSRRSGIPQQEPKIAQARRSARGHGTRQLTLRV